MKTRAFILAVFSIVITTSCDEKNQETLKSDSLDGVESEVYEQRNEETTKVKPDKKNVKFESFEEYDGEWISANYLEKIGSEKSIYNNQDYSTKIFGFTLDQKNLISDSPELFGFTVHEGGYYAPLVFDTVKNHFENDLGRIEEHHFFKEQFYLDLEDSNSISMVFPKSNQVDKFRKINNNLDTEFRRLIISGKYVNIDDSSKVLFYKNGIVKNFHSYQSYELIYDFIASVQFDAVVFYESQQVGEFIKGSIYKYEIDGDTLKLININADWNSLEHVETDEVIKLKRID